MIQIIRYIKTVLCIVAIITGNLINGSVYAQNVESKIDEYLSAHVQQGSFSGVVLVAKSGKILACKSYGMANYEHDIPNSPQTKFQIGSMTKSFTAFAIMLLENSKLLSFEDALAKYLPDFPGGKNITIHHLLTHTSGIPKLEDIPNYNNLIDTNTPLEEIIKNLHDLPVEFAPGDDYSYSNSGYMILGLVIEKVTEGPYGVFLKEHIFDPLEMKNTIVADPTDLIKNRASGYTAGGDAGLKNAEYENLFVLRGAGGICSTVEDLYLWDRALYTDKLLDQESLEKAYILPEGRRYGYGWVISKRFGHNMIWHDGSTAGFQSYFARFPDDDACIIILSNFVHTRMPTIRKDLAAILFGESYKLPTAMKLATVDPAIFNLYSGKYKLVNDDIITITKEGDHLYGEALSAPMKFELFPVSQDKFSVKVKEGVGFSFKKDDADEYNLIILHWGSSDIPGERIE
jgi:CubicO group peptidase (beta-lactamase class C family)